MPSYCTRFGQTLTAGFSQINYKTVEMEIRFETAGCFNQD